MIDFVILAVQESFLDDVADAMPRVLTAIGVLLVGWIVGRLVRRMLHSRWSATQTESFARVFSKLSAWGIWIVTVIFGVTVLFPSIEPVTIISGLGIMSVAIGFAFKDILENLLAGILLILRQPFRAGDLVEVDGETGIVEGISIRETWLKTFDGHRLLIPNATVYKAIVEIPTHFPVRRFTADIGVSYDADPLEARRVVEDAVRAVDGVLEEPIAEVHLTGFGASSVDLQIRYWVQTVGSEPPIPVVIDEVMGAAKQALEGAGIEIPYQTVTVDADSALLFGRSEQ